MQCRNLVHGYCVSILSKCSCFGTLIIRISYGTIALYCRTYSTEITRRAIHSRISCRILVSNLIYSIFKLNTNIKFNPYTGSASGHIFKYIHLCSVLKYEEIIKFRKRIAVGSFWDYCLDGLLFASKNLLVLIWHWLIKL